MLLRVVGIIRGAVVGDQSEQAIRATNALANVEADRSVTLLVETPDQPRVEAVVAKPVGDVVDARQEVAVDVDTWAANPEVV